MDRTLLLENRMRIGRTIILSLVATTACVSVVAAVASPPQETMVPLFDHAIPDTPGKTFTAVVVNFPPGAKAVPHRHGNAFVYAYVLAGAVRSQLDDEEAKVYRVGENWFEPPGAHHRLTENVSGTSPARLLVVFVANSGAALKTPDPR